MDDRKNEYSPSEEKRQPETGLVLSTQNRSNADNSHLRWRHPVRTLIIAVILLLVGTLTVFFLKFTVRILADDGKIGLSVAEKGSPLQERTEQTQSPITVSERDRELTPRAQDDGSRMSFTTPHFFSERSDNLSEVYARVAPCVVCIETTGTGKSVTGSGVVMSESGYIITNYHIVNGAERIRVLLDNEEFDGVLVGSDAVTDLAVVKIDKSNCAYAEFADSDNIMVGESVAAIGNPLGASLPGTMTNGIICAINRGVTLNGHSVTLIQTNAALYDGSSGGPLVNMNGQVIGINTIDSVSLSEDITGIGFALPSNFVKTIVDQLIETGYISGRPSLGIVAVDYDLPAQAVLFYGTPGGVLVSSVYAGSQAESSGIQVGDIIVTVDGSDVYSVSDLTQVISNHQIGDSVEIVIFRNGRYYQTTLDVVDEGDFKK